MRTLYVVATRSAISGTSRLAPPRCSATVAVVAAEDTRRTRGLLSHLGASPTLLSYHAHSEERRLETLLEILADGRDVALVTDAGTPGVSDPGPTWWRRRGRRASPSCRSRALRRGHRAVGRRAPGRPLSLPRLRPPKGRRARPAARPCGGGGVERRPLRGPAAAGGAAARSGGGGRARPARGGRPRADQAARGAPGRHPGRAADYYSEIRPRGELTIVLEGTGAPPAAARPHRGRGRSRPPRCWPKGSAAARWPAGSPRPWACRATTPTGW